MFVALSGESKLIYIIHGNLAGGKQSDLFHGDPFYIGVTVS